jgi:hypothetical protein
MHIADRKITSKNKRRQCERVCQKLLDGSSRAISYRNTLNGLCQPKDKYVACVYHTMKFDVIGSLV